MIYASRVMGWGGGVKGGSNGQVTTPQPTQTLCKKKFTNDDSKIDRRRKIKKGPCVLLCNVHCACRDTRGKTRAEERNRRMVEQRTQRKGKVERRKE